MVRRTISAPSVIAALQATKRDVRPLLARTVDWGAEQARR